MYEIYNTSPSKSKMPKPKIKKSKSHVRRPQMKNSSENKL
jgi:hypothetical protein